MIHNRTDLIEILKGIPWFLGLDSKQLECLAGISSIEEIKANEQIFCEGDRVDNLYIILSGQVGVDMAVPTRGQVRIYVAEALDIIGWSKMTPMVRQRTASAYALTKTRLLIIQGDELATLCEDDHHVGYIIMRRLANVVAGNLLTVKLQLMDLILQDTAEPSRRTEKE
jgi:CRP/FNR family transcriptional regulator, cyclic AMP receptor protein